MDDVKLTRYSHGAGCGCKIAPDLLDAILRTARPARPHPNLLVGNDTKDDAAAFDLGDGTSVLSTADFFMPIVDDPYLFGRIAAVNALSDVYAMGGEPLMAISVFGWPIDKLSDIVARQVIDGGRSACDDAGIPLAGGHSIDSPEPIFGLAVTGRAQNRFLKRNAGAEPACELFLTKPLGIGILTTAQKKGIISPEDLAPAIEAMCTLNKAGAALAKIDGVTAMTDVTGFGLLGHLCEICEGSNLSATLLYDRVPKLPKAETYLSEGCSPGGTAKNFRSYERLLGPLDDRQRGLLCDPQTSGGLLCVVRRDAVDAFLETAADFGPVPASIGHTRPRTDPLVVVE